ncbi:MAG TPA: MFS transporter [Stellaceae bacterium]
MADRDRPGVTLIVTCISYIVVILDTSIVNVALERIGGGLHADTAGLQWVVNAYTLIFASLLLTGGTLGDRWGARRVYLLGMAIFAAASAACAAAPSLPLLVAARAVQGIGAALVVPNSLVMLNGAYADAGARKRAVGIFAGGGGIALASGPLAGGALIALFGWRAIFFVNLPICLAGMALAWRLRDRGPASRRAFDPAGQVAAIVTLAALAAGLIEGRALGWWSPATLGIFATALAGLAVFLRVESRVAEPMVPLAILRRPAIAASAAVALVMTFCLFGLIFILSLYFQQIRLDSPLAAGAALLPTTASVTVTNLLSGRLGGRYGTRLPILLGLGAAVLGFLCLLPLGPNVAYAWLVGPLLALGVAGGLVTPAVTSSLMEAAAGFEPGLASGVLNAARQIGTVLGVALLGTLIADRATFMSGMRWDMAIAATVSLAAGIAALRWLPAGTIITEA